MLKRKIYQRMLDWKQNSQGSSALMIEGARRVGKSYIVEEFGRKEYDSYILINFTQAPNAVKEWFGLYMEDLDKLLQNIQLHYNTKLTVRHSLIIFDEVQDCPKAREAVKFLVADGRYDYIETGSLVSIKSRVKDINIPSEEEAIDMYPLDFEEFLWAMGNELLMPYCRECLSKLQPLGQVLHRKAMDLFRLYMVIGGMPQAVQEYVNSKDFDRVETIKRRILNLYRNDIRKYANNEELKAISIFDEIPGQLQKHEKKFMLSSLGSGARMRDYQNAFLWLSDAKVINCCYNTTEPSIGLRLNDERTTLKCYMGDTGLLISHAFDENGKVPIAIYQKLILGKLETNEGMIMENVVAQMLTAAGHKLYFYSNPDREDKDNRMEIDFLISKSRITNKHNISPIEVKSGKVYKLTSLRKCIRKYEKYLSTPYVVHPADLKVDGSIVFLPLYMVPLLGDPNRP